MRTGIEPGVFVDVLTKCGGHGAALDLLRPYLLNSDSSALRFAMSNAQKDLGYDARMVEETGDIAPVVLSTFVNAVAQAGFAAFVPELVILLKTRIVTSKPQQD